MLQKPKGNHWESQSNFSPYYHHGQQIHGEKKNVYLYKEPDSAVLTLHWLWWKNCALQQGEAGLGLYDYTAFIRCHYHIQMMCLLF